MLTREQIEKIREYALCAAADEYFGWSNLSFESKEELFAIEMKQYGVVSDIEGNPPVSKEDIEEYAAAQLQMTRAYRKNPAPMAMALLWNGKCVAGVKLGLGIGSKVYEREWGNVFELLPGLIERAAEDFSGYIANQWAA